MLAVRLWFQTKLMHHSSRKKTTVRQSLTLRPSLRPLLLELHQSLATLMKLPLLHTLNHTPWIAQQLRTVQQQPWDMDVHTHVAAIVKEVHTVIKDAYVPPPPKPRKTTITATTWDMVLNKRQARNDLYLLRRQQQSSLLHTCFIGWRDGPLDIPARKQCSRILADQDQRLAVALNRFRILGRAVCRALRADDLNFYSRLSSEAADFLGPHQAKKFWSVIRRALPQHRQRRSQPAPMSLQHLDDQVAATLQSIGMRNSNHSGQFGPRMSCLSNGSSTCCRFSLCAHRLSNPPGSGTVLSSHTGPQVSWSRFYPSGCFLHGGPGHGPHLL